MPVVLAAVLAVAGCGEGASGPGTAEGVAATTAGAPATAAGGAEATPTSPPGSAGSGVAPATGSSAPSALPTVELLRVADGAPVGLDQVADGDRPLLLWFWAPH